MKTYKGKKFNWQVVQAIDFQQSIFYHAEEGETSAVLQACNCLNSVVWEPAIRHKEEYTRHIQQFASQGTFAVQVNSASLVNSTS